ncbi:MAG: nucleoside triphosphate pyrophosphatase [Desulfuromonadales bacterium]|nr:nucleoside triphosphate pyrophosphatase [Desulfuromonadales bacterium]MDW7756427.1 nucleoside triphosphate pyrophosphatase [Desulfuromonadales bacterium]
MRSIVLASTSPYRRQLLRQLEIPFVADAPLYKEEMHKGIAPELLVKHLAYHKAHSLRERYPEALIIGSDQIFVDPRNQVLGKPMTQAKAVEQLRAMAGRSHTFYTGVTVFDASNGQSLSDFATCTVTLKTLTDEQISRYVQRENPVDCAGSFKIEGLGIALMQKVEGEDYTSLIGLPLIKLVDLLGQFGVEVI